MQRPITACLLTGWLFAAPATAAQAGETKPDSVQAQALEQQIGDLLAPLLGPQKRPVRLTPAGDHYAVEMPLAPMYEPLGIHITGDSTATGTLTPIDGGRWAIDGLALPSPTHVVIESATPDKGKPAPPGPMTVDLTMRDQTSHTIIDPAFATPWTLNSAANGFDLSLDNKNLNQVSHAGHLSMHAALTPVADGRLDVTETFEVRNYASDATMGAGPHLHTGIGRLAGTLHLERLDRARMGNALALILAARAKHIDGQPIPKPEMNALLHQVILALRDSAGSGGLSQTMEGIEFKGPGGSFTLARFAAGLDADAPQGKLGARMTLVLDGPYSASIPPTAMPYVPSHLAMQPYISGLGLAELTQLALDATSGGTPPVPDPSVLFAHGALTAGIEHLELIVGETAFKGSGKVEAASPAEVSGHATITASHFDALVKNVQNDQVLGPQALPVLLLVRGLARPDGDNLVWEITYEAGAIKVNGTDLSALTGARK